MEALSYIIVGSGFRAEFYARIANTYPQQFRAMFFCRSEEKEYCRCLRGMGELWIPCRFITVDRNQIGSYAVASG